MPASPLRFDIRQAGRRMLLSGVTLALLNLGFYLLYTRPAVREYRRLEATTRPDFDEVKKREKSVQRLEAFRDGLQQAEADLQSLRNDVLSTRNDRLVEIQAEVAGICAEFNIDLESVSYGHELLLEEELDRLEMTVPLEGGYANLRKFLQAIERSDKFLLVERVALAKGEQGGRLLDLNISLATYFNAPADWIEKTRQVGQGSRRRRA